MFKKIVITPQDIKTIYPSQKNQPVFRVFNLDKGRDTEGNYSVLKNYILHDVVMVSEGDNYFFITILDLNTISVEKFFLEITLPFSEKFGRIKIRSFQYTVNGVRKQTPNANEYLINKYNEVFKRFESLKDGEYFVKIDSFEVNFISDE